MREFIYLTVVINVIIGLFLMYRRPRPFGHRTYREYAGEQERREKDMPDNIR